jgi:hypothetical protein
MSKRRKIYLFTEYNVYLSKRHTTSPAQFKIKLAANYFRARRRGGRTVLAQITWSSRLLPAPLRPSAFYFHERSGSAAALRHPLLLRSVRPVLRLSHINVSREQPRHVQEITVGKQTRTHPLKRTHCRRRHQSAQRSGQQSRREDERQPQQSPRGAPGHRRPGSPMGRRGQGQVGRLARGRRRRRLSMPGETFEPFSSQLNSGDLERWVTFLANPANPFVTAYFFLSRRKPDFGTLPDCFKVNELIYVFYLKILLKFQGFYRDLIFWIILWLNDT